MADKRCTGFEFFKTGRTKKCELHDQAIVGASLRSNKKTKVRCYSCDGIRGNKAALVLAVAAVAPRAATPAPVKCTNKNPKFCQKRLKARWQTVKLCVRKNFKQKCQQSCGIC